MKTKVLLSTTYNPWYNLSLEEYLLDKVKESEVIFYLWQNQNTVVIGRNQNAWKECHCSLLEKNGYKLARRLSGGGAVFHDLGNLNFTFLMGKGDYDLKRQLSVILEAVKKTGIEAEFSGRNDLLASGRKFSGNAYYYSSNSAYHHGTILVDTDFEKLVTYLQVSTDKIKSKGIDSVRSRVINLKELNPDISIERVKEKLIESFGEIYTNPSEITEINPAEIEELAGLYNKYSSWEWLYGNTPEFDIEFTKRFEWGGIDLGLKLKKGYIEEAVIFSDSMEADLIQELASAIKGFPFRSADINNELKKYEINEATSRIVQDLQKWLREKIT